jgi:hypothetical protein
MKTTMTRMMTTMKTKTEQTVIGATQLLVVAGNACCRRVARPEQTKVPALRRANHPCCHTGNLPPRQEATQLLQQGGRQPRLP